MQHSTAKTTHIDEYLEFLQKKIVRFEASGFEVGDLNKNLFDFQKHIVRKSVSEANAHIKELIDNGVEVQFFHNRSGMRFRSKPQRRCVEVY